ncbi:MAG: GTPase Era [Deltaproteobacteria bacterium]|nr:GTPase Era [Deltaproteobacteria bacterium]
MTVFKSGFVGILGRPNVGKSTLLNILCGEKLAIISAKPQTTRNRILGVLHGSGFQIVFLDTPGMHEFGKALNRYMRGVIEGVAKDVDTVIYMVDATREQGREDALALDLMPAGTAIPVILAVNKVDQAGEKKAGERAKMLEEAYPFSGIFPVSALKGTGIESLREHIIANLPEGVPYFPEDMVTDQPLDFRLAEIIREKLFDLTGQEVPYAAAVVVEDVSPRNDGLLEVSGMIYVERETQKGIIIGKGGRMIQDIGKAARLDMEQWLGRKVYLALRVKVKKKWTDREGILRQFGYR